MANKTDVETRMQGVANGGYRPEDVVPYILLGQKLRSNRQLGEIIARIAGKMEKLIFEEVEHIELTVDAFIKRHEMSKEEWTITDAEQEVNNG